MKTITVAIIIALTILGVKAMNVGLKPPPAPPAEIRHRVDTVRVYDTVTVISRAADTVRVVIHKTGPLTQAMLVNMICSERWLNDGSGEFAFNGYGMVFCPKREDK